MLANWYNTKTRMKKRQYTAHEMELRRFHADVRKLKKTCEDKGIVLKTYEDASDDDICVLSNNEYEISETKFSCDPEHENYFVDCHFLELITQCTTC